MEATVGESPLHGSGGARGRAAVCVSGDTPRAQVTRALERTGFEVLDVVDRGLELLQPVADHGPDVVVLDVALVGTLGLRLFGLIKHLSPDTAIVALTPLHTLHVAALEAGAYAVVQVDDLRGLTEALGELAGSTSP